MSVSFSSDDSRIVSGSSDNTIKVWDATSGEEQLTLKGHTSSVLSVSFSSDDSRIVSGSSDNTIKVWDATSGEEQLTLKGHTSSVSVSFSSDDSRIVSGSSDNTIKVWDATSGEEQLTLKGHNGPVYSVSLSSDDSRIVSGSDDNTIKVWDATSGEEQLTLKGHTNSVRSVSFSSDDSRIVSGSSDNTIKVWDATSGEEQLTLKGHTSSVLSVSFSSDGSRIVSGSSDNTIKVWDATSGEELHTLKGHTGWVYSVNFSSDDSRIVSGSLDNTIKVWDATSGEEQLTLKGHNDWVRSVSFSSDDSRIVSGSDDNTIKVWDATSGEEQLTLKGHNDWVRSVSFSSDDSRIVSGSDDNTIKVWDATSGEEQLTLKGHTSSVWSVSFSSDDSRIVSGSDDNTIKVWDATSGEEQLTLKGHTSSVWSVCFSSDDSRIVSGSDDNTIKVWDATSGEEQLTLKGHNGPVYSVSLSSDDSRIVSGSDDNTIKVWDATSGEEQLTLKGHNGPVYSVSLSSDDSRIVSGSDDNTIKVWDATSGEEQLTLKGHNGPVYSVSLSSDDSRIVSGSDDNTIKVWDATSQVSSDTRELFSIYRGSDDRWLAAHASGKVYRHDDGWLLSLPPRGQKLASPLIVRKHERITLTATAKESQAEIVRQLIDSTLRKLGQLTLGIRPATRPTESNEDTPASQSTTAKSDTTENDGSAAKRTELENQLARLRAELPDKIRADQRAWGGFELVVTNPKTNERAIWPKIRVLSSEKGFFSCTAVPLVEPAIAIEPGGQFSFFVMPWVTGATDAKPQSIRRNPKTWDDKLKFEIDCQNSEPVTCEVPIELKTASVDWTSDDTVELVRTPKSATLRCSVRNTGNLALGGLGEMEITLVSPSVEPVTITVPLPRIEPNSIGQIDFPIKPNQMHIVSGETLPLVKRRISSKLPLPQVFEAAKPVSITSQETARGIVWIAVLAGLISLCLILFAGLFFHPFLTAVAKSPEAVFAREVNELPLLSRILSVTRRIGSTRQVVRQDGWQAARQYVRGRQPGDRLNELAKALRWRSESVQSNADGLAITKLNVPKDYLLPLETVFLVAVPESMIHKDVPHALSKIPGWSRQSVSLLVPATQKQADDLEHLSRENNWFVTLDPVEITRLLLDRDPHSHLVGMIGEEIEVISISPYRTAEGVTNSAMFFGRNRQIANILNQSPRTYFVVGGRQSGKSSLLKEIDRQCRDSGDWETIYVPDGDESLPDRIGKKLGLQVNSSNDLIGHLQSRTNTKPLLFLIDEADEFTTDPVGQKILPQLKGLAAAEKCFFVFAGFWLLYREIVFNFQSPLRNFGDMLRIGAMEPEAATEFIRIPMTRLGLEFEDDADVDRICRETGRKANLVAITCDEALKKLPFGQRIISTDSIDKAFRSDQMLAAMAGWGQLSGSDMDSPENRRSNLIDRLIVCSHAAVGEFTHGDAVQSVEDCNVLPNEIDQSLHRLELGNVLERHETADSTNYSFLIPLQHQLIKRQSPEAMAKQARLALQSWSK